LVQTWHKLTWSYAWIDRKFKWYFNVKFSVIKLLSDTQPARVTMSCMLLCEIPEAGATITIASQVLDTTAILGMHCAISGSISFRILQPQTLAITKNVH